MQYQINSEDAENETSELMLIPKNSEQRATELKNAGLNTSELNRVSLQQTTTLPELKPALKRGRKYTAKEVEELLRHYQDTGECPWDDEYEYKRKLVNKKADKVDSEEKVTK